MKNVIEVFHFDNLFLLKVKIFTVILILTITAFATRSDLTEPYMTEPSKEVISIPLPQMSPQMTSNLPTSSDAIRNEDDSDIGVDSNKFRSPTCVKSEFTMAHMSSYPLVSTTRKKYLRHDRGNPPMFPYLPVSPIRKEDPSHNDMEDENLWSSSCFEIILCVFLTCLIIHMIYVFYILA